MKLPTTTCVFVICCACCLNVLATEIFTIADSSDSDSEKPCKWPSPPKNGVNFKRCGTRFCAEREGSLKPPGFVKYTECQKGFLMVQGEREAFCDNGSWTSEEYKCVECGRSQLNEVTLIHYGNKAKRGDFPWTAGLFFRNESNQWVLNCGATLISDHLVLTAAHCVKLDNSTFVKPENIQVAFGKLYTDMYITENDAVIMTVREVIVPQRYVGGALNYDLDIALLDLDTLVTIGPNIMPVCVDWGNNIPLDDNKEGYLSGYGRTEERTQSDVLKWSRQKYVEYSSCIEKIPPEKIRQLTPDKFCVISVKGARADFGDSGSGLTFVKSDVHYVFGVVSVKITKDGEEVDIVLFTNVLHHKDWLLQHWKRLNHFHGKRTGFNKKAALGDVCRQAGDEFWTCKRENECPRAKTNLRNGVQSEGCNINDDKTNEPSICCQPEMRSKHSPSLTMCREYARSLNRDRTLCNHFKERIEPGVWTNIKPGEFPHWAMVSNNNFESWLYANLISDRFLLTDANFLEKSRQAKNKYTKAMLGVYHAKDKGNAEAKEYDIEETIIHPEYKLDKWYEHNIALIKLKTSVSFSSSIRPICLHHDFVFPETHIISTGELITDKKIILKENSLVIPRKECNFWESPDTSIICVNIDKVDEVGLLNAMPLMLRLEEPRCMYGLVGINNFGLTTTRVIHGYTRILHYIPWIESIVWPS